MTWDQIIEEVGRVIKGSGGYAEYVKGNPWDKTRKEIGEEKTKKFIKLFCKVNSLDYEKTLNLNEGMKITVDQVKKVFDLNEKIEIKIDFEK